MSVGSIAIIAIGILCYWPFVQMRDIDVEEYLGYHSDGSTHDETLCLLTCLRLYPSCWFIHKGDFYPNVPLHDLDNNIKTVNIKINWDNSITISEKSLKYVLFVNKIEIEPEIYPLSDKDYPLKLHNNRDSLCVGVYIYDNQKNEVTIYRQKRTLPLGGRRVGFRININGKVYVTGKRERFDY